ncbi:hypothetical protein L3Q82_024388, partial [Scortum barcoo]
VSVINTVDTSHEDMIHDAQMDYYGTRLATCSSDRTVKIFDVRNGGQILVADLRGHEGPVWQVAWAHPMFGNILASCSYDRKVIIWREENGSWDKMYEYTGHESSVNSVCWGPYDFGLILACGSSDGAISLLTFTGDQQWDVKKISNAHTIGCNAVSWAPAVVPGSLIDQPSGQKPNYVKRFVSGGCDNLVKLWKEEDGQWKEDQKLEAHSDWVRDVGWAPSIGLPTSTIASCSQDGRVFIWTCDDPAGNTWTAKLLHKFNDVVWHVSWSITGNILAVSGGDNKVTLWKESMDGQWACISDVSKGQGAVSTITDTQQSEQSSCKQMEPEVNVNPEQSDFAAFVSDGHVSLVGSEVKGEVVMGMRPALPVQGVDVILGNDLAVTRTLYQAKEEPEVEQSVKVSTVSMPVSLSSVSHSDLVAEQRADPTLAPRMDQPFMLQVDANDVGAGAVLLQADRNGVEHPEFFLQEV